MEPVDLSLYQQVNKTRFQRQAGGFYESFFLRANHPDRALAFWIRYTIFSPKGHPADAIGELWAVLFDGVANHHIAIKQELPFGDCIFDEDDFEVRIGQSYLRPGICVGKIVDGEDVFEWNLTFDGNAPPLLLLPQRLYETRFPAAKSLVSLPLACFKGTLSLNSDPIQIDRWYGSQNHNWGIRHTDLYAWGQVAGFDNDPEVFLEIATARLHFGPVWSPPFTPMVLRYKGVEYGLRGLLQSLRAHGAFGYFTWNFKSEIEQVAIEGTIKAPRQAFVGLTYYNPPGGVKYCLNSKIASCSLELFDKEAGTSYTLVTKNRAAFEILTDDPDRHGITMAV
jgi:hypothetical protein